jgi:quinol monooxygenase YgiN
MLHYYSPTRKGPKSRSPSQNCVKRCRSKLGGGSSIPVQETKVIVVTLTVHPDSLEAFKKAALENAIESRKEEGCISFDIFKHAEKDNVFVFCEKWKNAKAILDHQNTAHISAWRIFNRGNTANGKGKNVLSINVEKYSIYDDAATARTAWYQDL